MSTNYYPFNLLDERDYGGAAADGLAGYASASKRFAPALAHSRRKSGGSHHLGAGDALTYRSSIRSTGSARLASGVSPVIRSR